MALFTRILRSCLRILWPRYNSVWDSFDTLTCSTWHLSLDGLSRWIHSDQQGLLEPEPRRSHRLILVQVWMGVNAVRYAIYLALLSTHPALIVNNQLVKPHFPYYFGDSLQLATNFVFYSYTAAVGGMFFCSLSAGQLRLNRYLGKRIKHLRWYRIYVYVEAILKLDQHKAQAYLRMLQHISPVQYVRYRHKFQRALRVERFVLRLNNIIILFNFLGAYIKVYRHPEWEFPLAVVIVTEFAYQVCYYFMIRITHCLQIVFYINAKFITMLLDSILDHLKSTNKTTHVSVVLNQFADAFRALVDFNLFWSLKMGQYYLLIIPTVIPFIYLFFYVPINLTYRLRILYIILLYPFSMLFINWTAGRVSTTSRRIYNQIYEGGAMEHVNVSTRLKVITELSLVHVSCFGGSCAIF